MNTTIFYGYSSDPSSAGIAGEAFVKSINKNQNFKVKSWRDMSVESNILINTISFEIYSADVCIFDVTGMNPNVLFELGYAIGKRKRFWIIFDTSNLESVSIFKEFELLSTVGYSSYNSSEDILTSFINKFSLQQNIETFNINIDQSFDVNNEVNAIFYLKGRTVTDYTTKIHRTIDISDLPYYIDDYLESGQNPLSWYISKLNNSYSIVAEFSSINRIGHQIHNLKCAFVSGIAYGMGLKVKMMVEKPYPVPLDYKDLLVRYTSMSLCESEITNFVNNIYTTFYIEQYKNRNKNKLDKQNKNKLENIRFGDFTAENEKLELNEYYIEIASIGMILSSDYNIVVSRKGTGKTAMSYYLEDKFSKDKRYTLVSIRPVNFELLDIITVIKKYEESSLKTYFIESLWKYILYTELLFSIGAKLKVKDNNALTPEENNLLNFIDENFQDYQDDVADRARSKVKEIITEFPNIDGDNYKIKFSEILHTNYIKTIKNHILNTTDKILYIRIIIDNLDKSWGIDDNVEILSKFLVGLLSVSAQINNEFNLSKAKGKIIDFKSLLFIRSDIFNSIIKYAREPDKLQDISIFWNDREVLFNLVNERISFFTNNKIDISSFWTQYIVLDNMEIHPFDQILDKILLRPRDLIYFLRYAHQSAVTRNSEVITQKDFNKAYSEYSKWVYKSILPELPFPKNIINEFAIEFLFQNKILSYEEITTLYKDHPYFSNQVNFEKLIDVLLTISFLGLEIETNEFIYSDKVQDFSKYLGHFNRKSDRRFRIHDAFIGYLEAK